MTPQPNEVWEKEFNKEYIEWMDNIGNLCDYAADMREDIHYHEVRDQLGKGIKSFIRKVLSHHEAAIRREIREKLERMKRDNPWGKIGHFSYTKVYTEGFNQALTDAQSIIGGEKEGKRKT